MGGKEIEERMVVVRSRGTFWDPWAFLPVGLQSNGVPRFMKGYTAHQKVLNPVERPDIRTAAVHAYVDTPKAGIFEKDMISNPHESPRLRFSGCSPC